MNQHDQRSEEHKGHIHLLGEALSHAVVHTLKLGVHALLNGLETLVNDFELRLDLGDSMISRSERLGAVSMANGTPGSRIPAIKRPQ